jgi:hypothetical protein
MSRDAQKDIRIVLTQRARRTAEDTEFKRVLTRSALSAILRDLRVKNLCCL